MINSVRQWIHSRSLMYLQLQASESSIILNANALQKKCQQICEVIFYIDFEGFRLLVLTSCLI